MGKVCTGRCSIAGLTGQRQSVCMVRWSALITIRAVSVIALIAGHEFTEERSVYDDESGAARRSAFRGFDKDPLLRILNVDPVRQSRSRGQARSGGEGQRNEGRGGNRTARNRGASTAPGTLTMNTTRCALEGRRTAAMMDVNRPLDSTDSTIDCSNDGCEPPPQEPISEYFFHAGVNVRVDLIVGRHGSCGSGSTFVMAARPLADEQVRRKREEEEEGRRTAAMMDVNRPLDSTDSTIDCSNDGCEPPPQEPISEYFFHAGVNVRVDLIVGRHGSCGSGSTLVTARRTAAVATSVADDAVTASTAVQPQPSGTRRARGLRTTRAAGQAAAMAAAPAAAPTSPSPSPHLTRRQRREQGTHSL